MGRRSSHGEYPSVFGGILRRRLKSVDVNNVDVDSLVDRFRSVYPEYRRADRELFAERVRLLLPSSSFKSAIPRKIAKELDSAPPPPGARSYSRRVSSCVKSNKTRKGRDGLGFGRVIWKLTEELVLPLYRQEELRHLGLEPMTGILLHGPPGCGKTKLAHVIAQEARVRFYKLSATQLLSGVSGVSAENIQVLFTKSFRTTPSILFIDEIDVITTRMEENLPRQIVTQLMTCMDESHRPVKSVNRNDDSDSSNGRPGCVLVIGATSRPDAIDPALRRPGRFDYVIGLGVPDEEARVQVLTVLTRNLRIEGAIDLTKVARSTPGYVGADLTAKAGNHAMKSVLNHRKDAL
ncbi:cell division control protein 48 homolog C-like [Henckelia pumila]|uniref:cell division control protein 48 homolog C-like n=1 Tax=Henckelia pumila TaxID=405737 RepID=UPI003C6E11CD